MGAVSDGFDAGGCGAKDARLLSSVGAGFPFIFEAGEVFSGGGLSYRAIFGVFGGTGEGVVASEAGGAGIASLFSGGGTCGVGKKLADRCDAVEF